MFRCGFIRGKSRPSSNRRTVSRARAAWPRIEFGNIVSFPHKVTFSFGFQPNLRCVHDGVRTTDSFTRTHANHYLISNNLMLIANDKPIKGDE